MHADDVGIRHHVAWACRRCVTSNSAARAPRASVPVLREPCGSRRSRACRTRARAAPLPDRCCRSRAGRASGPYKPCAFENSFLFHLPARSSATLSGTRRSIASISANASSGDGDRVLARAIRHVDAALRRRGDVDRVDARAGAHDQRQLAARPASRPVTGCCARPAPARRSSVIASARRRSFRSGSYDDLAAARASGRRARSVRTCRRRELSYQMREQAVAKLRLEPG